MPPTSQVISRRGAKSRHVLLCVLSHLLCPTRNPMACGLPGSLVHCLSTKILERVCHFKSLFQRIFLAPGINPMSRVSCTGKQVLYH